MQTKYDVIVIGGGPAGYTAAMYAARSGFSTLVIEKQGAGGQMNETQKIENYPGFPEGIDGFTLGQNMQKGAHRDGVETLYAQVQRVQLRGRTKLVHTTAGEVAARSVVIATGAGHKHLGIADEERLIGKGVAYCATCDGMFYRNKTVAVVGGGNSAVADAMVLARIAKNVILIHRRDKLRASKLEQDRLQQLPNVQIRFNSEVEQFLYGDKLQGICLRNTRSGQQEVLTVDGLFVSIGRSPATELFAGELELDENGYIIAGEDTKTNIAGVYAVGDVRTGQVRQIVTAVADGAVAAHQLELFLQEAESKEL